MLFLSRPQPSILEDLKRRLADADFNYRPQGMTGGAVPTGFVLDETRVELGSGDELLKRARGALAEFGMFGMDWIDVCWQAGPPEAGQPVATLSRHFGVWSLDPCRVVSTFDEPARFGFAYGTLTGHQMSGEERFTIKQESDGSVWFEIRAVSAPASWLSRLSRPYVRRLQRRFAVDAPASLRRRCRKETTAPRALVGSGVGKTVLLTGATGFVGSALDPILVESGYDVRRASRHPPDDPSWVELDVTRVETIEGALDGCDCCVYLIHRMESHSYEDEERRAAEAFLRAAERAGVARVVYLGGVAPAGVPSRHLRSRLASGEMLRSGALSTIELRAGMIIGAESASWQIVRDLAARLPLMVLPRWLDNRSQPIALDDVLVALAYALQDPLSESACFDLPGPEVMSGREILGRVARRFGIRPVMIPVPFLTPRLSAHWLRLVTRSNMQLAYQLVEGLVSDLVAMGPDYWERIEGVSKTPFDVAAQRAIDDESTTGLGGRGRRIEGLARLLSRSTRE